MCIRAVFVLAAFLPAALAACASGDSLVLGRKRGPEAGSASGASQPPGGFDNAGGQAPGVPHAAASLSVQIEREQVAVEIVTVQCAGDCADVEAVARGGYPPYTYAWEDGSTAPARRLCPGATQRFTVSATDSGLSSAEFQLRPRTAQSSVTAQVLPCSDAGVDAAVDAGPGSGPGQDSGPAQPDAAVGTKACFGPKSANATCTPLHFVPCEGDRLVAELLRPIEVGQSACVTTIVEDPTGALLPLGGFDLSTGSDACASSRFFGGYTTPVGSLNSKSVAGLCVEPDAFEPERITRIGMTPHLGFVGNPQLAKIDLCELCPLELNEP